MTWKFKSIYNWNSYGDIGQYNIYKYIYPDNIRITWNDPKLSENIELLSKKKMNWCH